MSDPIIPDYRYQIDATTLDIYLGPPLTHQTHIGRPAIRIKIDPWTGLVIDTEVHVA
jgi:hypothetical protein